MTLRQRIAQAATLPGVWLVTAALLLTLLFWFVGPLLTFGDARPLEAASTRLAVLLFVVLVWSVVSVLLLTRRKHADRAMLAALRRQQEEEQQASKAQRLTAEAELASFRNRARRAMRRAGGKRLRFSLLARDRYRIPWYLIIGSENSGKTALALNSNPMPLDGDVGLNGAAATFHLSNGAVLVEMAGRFLTSLPGTGTTWLWLRLLAHLRKLRPHQPVSGIIAVVDAGELAGKTPETVTDLGTMLRQRIQQVTDQLRTRPPVYIVVTKLDLLIGFEEFFDTLSVAERNAALGFAISETPESDLRVPTVERFEQGFSGMIERFSQHLLLRLDEEPDGYRRCRASEFPSQFAAMGTMLEPLIAQLSFMPDDADADALLVRGLFFVSATQSGFSVDTLARDLSSCFAQQPKNLALREDEPAQRGRPYFLRGLLSDVILPESGLGGLSRRATVIVWLRGVATNALLTFAVIAPLILLWLGFNEGQAYTVRLVDGVNTARAQLAMEPPLNGRSADFSATLNTLNELRMLANEQPDRATVGLYSTAAVEQATEQAYHKGINGMLLPFLHTYLRERLDDPQTPARLRLQQLKLYLMLAGVRSVDAKTVGLLADDFAERWLSSHRTPEITAHIANHLTEMMSSGAGLEITDMRLVESARARLADYTFARLAYDTLRSLPEVEQLPAWRPVDHMSISGSLALARMNGASFWDGVAGIHTRAGFFSTVMPASEVVSADLVKDLWVMGDPSNGVDYYSDRGPIREGLLDLYRVEYVRVWDSFLSELTIAENTDADEVARAMAIITSDPSPVTELLHAVADQVNLTPATTRNDKPIKAKSAQFGDIVAPYGATIAETVTNYYEDFLDSVQVAEGQESQLSVMIASLKPLYSQINIMATGDVLQLGDQPRKLFSELDERFDALPQILQPLFRRILSQAAAVTGNASGERIADIWTTTVEPICKSAIEGRYPFAPNSNDDTSLADFTTLFSPQGLIASFRQDYLAPYIDTTTKPWRWRGGHQKLDFSDELLSVLERAQDIATVYFDDANEPSVDFIVEAVWLEDQVRAMQLDIGGPTVVYKHGPPSSSAQKWPPPRTNADAILSMTPELEHESNVLRRQGPWAIFRLFAAGHQLQKDTKGPVSFGFSVGGRRATLSVAAAGTVNPFVQDLLTDFTCPVF